MCGIVGYSGFRNASKILLEGLSRLEYRGYDSSGMAVYGDDGKTRIVKAKGRLKVLSEVKTPSGKVLPNKFNSKADSIRVGKQYAMEAGAELIVVEQEANKQNKKSSK